MTPEEVQSAVFADGGLLPALDNGLEDSLLTDNQNLRWSYAEMIWRKNDGVLLQECVLGQVEGGVDQSVPT